MGEAAFFLLMMGGYWALMRYVLPKLGVPT
jgi:hypothetical protein